MFVQAPQSTGTFTLRARPLLTALRSRKLTEGRQTRLTQQSATLARFRVVAAAPGERYATQLPPSLPPLPAFLRNVGPTRDTAVVVFLDTGYTNRNRSVERPTSRPTQFYLGTAANPYQKFNDDLVYFPVNRRGLPVPMVLGDSQTWIIQNRGISANHPFHIHINPFQIMRVVYSSADQFAPYYAFLNAAAAAGHPIWSDVVPLPTAFTDSAGNHQYGQVIIRQRYEDFTGQYVMHCHILGHEERGMMQLLEVFPTLRAARAYMAAHPASAGLRGTRRTSAGGGGSGPGSGTGGGGGHGGGHGAGGGNGTGGGQHQHPPSP
jgi:uncharacterized membrane protein YgcG